MLLSKRLGKCGWYFQTGAHAPVGMAWRVKKTFHRHGGWTSSVVKRTPHKSQVTAWSCNRSGWTLASAAIWKTKKTRRNYPMHVRLHHDRTSTFFRLDFFSDSASPRVSIQRWHGQSRKTLDRSREAKPRPLPGSKDRGSSLSMKSEPACVSKSRHGATVIGQEMMTAGVPVAESGSGPEHESNPSCPDLIHSVRAKQNCTSAASETLWLASVATQQQVLRVHRRSTWTAAPHKNSASVRDWVRPKHVEARMILLQDRR